MSIHKSLKVKSALERQRSVLSRWERVLKLQEAGRWHEGDAILGLPKVRTKFKVRTRKAPKKEAAAVPGAEGAAAAAPAEGAKAAAGAPAKGAAPAAAKGAAAAAPAAKAAAAPAKKK